jgi:hypothetical protein
VRVRGGIEEGLYNLTLVSPEYVVIGIFLYSEISVVACVGPNLNTR